ncbi:MAG: LamG domain-containing protein, partial [Candidatus Woesearchaeota archaeon]
SFTPTTTQPYLVISTAEVAPNSGTQSVLARLLHNGTEKAYLSYEGKASTDIAVFATHLVVNATAGISQNFTLQAQSENAANKQIRNARITAVPLSTVFFNESEPTSTTTTSTWQNKTTLTFTMTSAQEALIIGSADINISSCTNGNFIGTFLAIDGQTIGNLTQGCQDYTDAYPFITAQLVNLSAGSHTAIISYNRIAGSAGIVSIRRARITIIPIAPNQPPSIAQVILNTTNPLTNYTDENLTAYIINATDPNKDPVKNITDWRVNNHSIAILNMPFEGGSNTTFTKDYTTFGNNGTVINATWLPRGGYDGWGAYDFNGIDSRIKVPNDSQNISRYGTWSFWIKINNNNTCQAFLSKRDTFYSNNAWGMGFQFAGPPNIRFEYSPTGGLHNFTVFSGALLPINKWTMLTFVYNADDTVQNARLYVNGIEATPEYYENVNEGLYLSNSDIYIGAVNNGSHCRLNGTIDEVRIYNRALSPEQILLLYQNQTTIIASQETEEDDVWYVCATPNDNQQDGTTKCSNNVTILAPIGYITWTNPSTNETPVYWNTSIRFNTTWTSGTSLSGYIFSINQSGWQNSSFTTFGGLTNESWNITTITADAGSIIGWYFWANNSIGNYNQTTIQNFTVMPRPTALIFSVNQTVYPQGHGDILNTQYNIPLNARFIDVRTEQPISNAYCNVTNNETTDIIELVYSPTTGNYTGNLSTRMLYDNVSLSAECTKKNYATATNTTSTKVWFITYLIENGNKTFDGVGEYTTYLERIIPSGGLYTKTINASLSQGDNLVQEFDYCGSGYACSLNRGYDVQNGIFSMKLNISINDTACKPKLCYLFRDPDFNKIYEDCDGPYSTVPANTPTIVENNITDTHLLTQGYYLGISLHLNCSTPVEEQVKIYYNYSGMPASFVITHPKPVEINTFISFSAQLESNYTIGPNRRINETRMATITFNNSMNYAMYLDYIFTPRIFSQYNNSIIPNTTYIYNSTGQLWASDNASAGAPQTAIVLSNNQIKWRTETIPNGTLRNETTQSVLLDCVRDEEYLGLNTTTQKEWNISVYSILTSVVSTQNLTVWTNYTAYGDITEITYAANLTNSTGTYDITGITILNETLTTLTFPNLTLVANASISIAITGKPKQRPYVKIIYPIGNTFDTNTIVPIVANITDPLGIKTAYANITLPNGSTQNVTFGRVQQPDNFDTNTLNTSWTEEAAISPLQTCYININETIPGMAFIGITGNPYPYTTGTCSIISKSITYGDFDTNITFILKTQIENDTVLAFGISETPTSANASRNAFIALVKQTGLDPAYMTYANDGNITGFISSRNTNDTTGRFRIQRTNNTFTFYSWNNTGNTWITETTQNLNLSNTIYIGLVANNYLPSFGTINASWDNFSLNTINYSVALFNQTNNTGLYNVTVIAINNINGINATQKTNFTIAKINNPPSIPYILSPAPGETVSGTYTITWMQVTDPDNDNLQFNITLLNPDNTFNATIVTNYGNPATTTYPWDTTNYPPGSYKLKVTVFENETIEKYATSSITYGTFTINDVPRITVVAPINESFPDRRRVSLVINATDANGIDAAIASVTLPDLSIENVTMGYRAVSDDFGTDTMGTYWDQYSLTGPSQNCITDIDTTMPGKAFISLSGDGAPETDTYCMIASTRAIDGDFDINITFDILSRIGQDGIVYLGLTEVPDPTSTSKTILYGISNWSGYEAGYEVYANDENYTGYPLYLRPSNDTSGKLRIKREGKNFSFYYWNNGWIEENLTQSTFDFARGLYVSFQIESAYPGWGSVNLTLDDFEVNSLNYTFAIFNNTWQTGNYNVTFTVNDTSGIINTAFTNFSVYLYNNKPSKPWILAPYIGQLISGLFNITWSPVIDE